MTRTDVKEKLKEIMIESLELKMEPGEIDGSNLIGELNINSVDALEILVWVENHFKITIPDEDLNATLLESLDNLADYLERKCQEQ